MNELYEGAIYVRDVPELNATIVVYPMIYNDRVCIGTTGSPLIDDAWCFDRGKAVPAAEAWDPRTQPEPAGWKKHPRTGRYRPDGDPAQETVLS